MPTYHYREPEITTAFWATTLQKVYGKHYKRLQWYTGAADSHYKQDLSVVLIDDTVRLYQVKTKYYTDSLVDKFDLNVYQAADYAKGDYPLHFIAFGILKKGVSVILRYEDYVHFWYSHLQYITPKPGKDYVQFTLSDLAQFDMRVWVTDLGRNWASFIKF